MAFLCKNRWRGCQKFGLDTKCVDAKSLIWMDTLGKQALAMEVPFFLTQGGNQLKSVLNKELGFLGGAWRHAAELQHTYRLDKVVE